MEEESKGNIIIYQSEDGKTHLEVRLDDKTVWLTQQQMADLYQTSRTNVVEHIKHIYEEKELTEEATCRKFRQVRMEGTRQVEREQPMMGLTSFHGEHPTLRDAKIAKNYLNADELKILNNLVSGYFDFAEIQAIKHRPMYMVDYIQHLDTIKMLKNKVKGKKQ